MMNTEKNFVKIGDVVEGYVSCGVKNPFYNSKCKAVVKRIVNTMWGCNIEVETIEKRTFEHEILTFNKFGKIIKTEIKYIDETYEGWLDQDREYVKICDAE